MLRTNEDKLPVISLEGRVANADVYGGFFVGADGVPRFHPWTGAIVYNVKVGDPAFGWEADHIEPAVSSIFDEKDREGPLNRGYNAFACVGNRAKVATGDAKGAEGVITGKHGGAEHVMIDFSDDVLEKLTHDDRFLIRARGQGLKLLDYPDVRLHNLDPGLLRKMGMRETGGGALEVSVAKVVPPHLMGSGVGSIRPMTGDYDIQTNDPREVEKYKLDEIRLGDLVALADQDNSFGKGYFGGGTVIGVVVHGDSNMSGHGPGVAPLMTTRTRGRLKPVADRKANLADLLGIGRERKEGKTRRAKDKKKPVRRPAR